MDQPEPAQTPDLTGLIRLVRTLRAGCPWDRKQTPGSMSRYLLEETYELVDAVTSREPADVCEELGDVLFHVFFIAHLFAEQGAFDLGAVVRGITEKMIRRHPHVFGDATVANADEVTDQWRRIKQDEKGESASVLDGIPVSQPALMRAYGVAARAAGTGFDWTDLDGVRRKVEEEWREFNTAVNSGRGGKAVSLEFGDILFTLVNIARFSGIHPETSLAGSIGKFEKRFRHMEKAAARMGRPLESLSREEWDGLWAEAKTAVETGESTHEDMTP